jgi:hypothetical protein
VLRLVDKPSTLASRAPARPANANPIDSSICRSSGLRRACRAVSPTICSANVRAEHGAFSQKKRRTPQLDLHPPTDNRRVGQAALIPAVHPYRGGPAARARRLPSSWPRPDPHRPTDLGDPLDHHIRQVRQQNPNPTLITTPSEMINRP